MVLAWAGVIFGFSSLPGSAIPGHYSELGHLGEYAIFGALLYFALRTRVGQGRAIALAVIIASAYGMTDEFHQRFVYMRTPDVADWALDTLGALAGATVSALAEGYARLLGQRAREREAAQ